MCYSALIEANVRKLESDFGAYIDIESYIDAFVLREKYKLANIPAGIDSYFLQNAKTADEKKLAKMARAHYDGEIQKIEGKIEKYSRDVEEAQAKIKAKPDQSKGARKTVESKSKSIEKLKMQLEHYTNIEESGAPRIFPLFYTPAIVQEKKQKKIKLFRYQLLQKSGKELTPFKYNLFNARRDNIRESRVWKSLFGKQHALFPFLRFYESVEGEDGEAQQIFFQPDNHEYMWAAAIYEECKTGVPKTLRSLAAVTDEPPPEVSEAGHDRCPAFLEMDAMEKWLLPGKSSKEELFDLLDQKVETYFDHTLVA